MNASPSHRLTSPTLPAPLRSLHALKALNVAAVGLSLGAIVSLPAAIVASPQDDPLRAPAVALGLPTALVGAAWAWLLLSRRTARRPRAGWAASIPLAWLNSTLIGGLSPVLGGDRSGPTEALVGAAIGATIGALVWIPALLATLLLFGVPIAFARRLARRGLSGVERGEGIIGAACAVIGLVALVTAAENAPSVASVVFTSALGLSGAAAGAVASGLAWVREAWRRRFVAGVAEGKVPGYRVEETAEERVLVRSAPQGHAYRHLDTPIATLTKRNEVCYPRL